MQMTRTTTSTGLIALTIAGLAALGGCASSTPRASEGVSMAAVSTGYTCPLTGEELPCPNCCPLNEE